LDVQKIVAELKSERDRLGHAIDALEGIGTRRASTKVTAATPATTGKRGGRLTAAGRKRLSEAMKRRWAERKKK
jgi:hypothetical protein